MECDNCKNVCYINSFGGWRWECFACGWVGREATDKEIEEDTEYVKKEAEKLEQYLQSK